MARPQSVPNRIGPNSLRMLVMRKPAEVAREIEHHRTLSTVSSGTEARCASSWNCYDVSCWTIGTHFFGDRLLLPEWYLRLQPSRAGRPRHPKHSNPHSPLSDTIYCDEIQVVDRMQYSIPWYMVWYSVMWCHVMWCYRMSMLSHKVGYAMVCHAMLYCTTSL